MVDSIRKGFSFFMMSMGVSTYAKKPKSPSADEAAPVKPK